MDLMLTPEEVRVLGSLIEKAVTTPEYYPLTLNSLTLACNQRSNRNPVVDYDEEQVLAALDSLREKGLVRRVDTAGGRAPKFRHLLAEALPLSQPQLAILCVMFLRGAQTLGEIRARTGRLFEFRDLSHVEEVLQTLVEPKEEDGLDEPMVAPLPLRPGSREVRFIHLFGAFSPQEDEVATDSEHSFAPVLEPRATKAEVETLREEINALRAQLEALQNDFNALKAELT